MNIEYGSGRVVFCIEEICQKYITINISLNGERKVELPITSPRMLTWERYGGVPSKYLVHKICDFINRDILIKYKKGIII